MVYRDPRLVPMPGDITQAPWGSRFCIREGRDGRVHYVIESNGILIDHPPITLKAWRYCAKIDRVVHVARHGESQ